MLQAGEVKHISEVAGSRIIPDKEKPLHQEEAVVNLGVGLFEESSQQRT